MSYNGPDQLYRKVALLRPKLTIGFRKIYRLPPTPSCFWSMATELYRSPHVDPLPTRRRPLVGYAR